MNWMTEIILDGMFRMDRSDEPGLDGMYRMDRSD